MNAMAKREKAALSLVDSSVSNSWEWALNYLDAEEMGSKSHANKITREENAENKHDEVW